MYRASTSFLPPVALNFDDGMPLYRQLSDWFRRAIRDGSLKPGQRVPSSRDLAMELAVSRISVMTAYEQLVAEGYLESFSGSRTCVAHTLPVDAVPQGSRSRSRAAADTTSRHASHRAGRIYAAEQPWSTGLGAFRFGLPALDRFPLKTWSRLVSRHSRRATEDLMAYGDVQGYLALRRAIAGYLGAFRSVRCDASQVLVTSGAQHGLFLVAQVLLDAGDEVWMEEPGNSGAHRALSFSKLTMIPVPVDREGLDVAAGLRRAPHARAAYVTPAHQFPTGASMSPARRSQLLGWAARSGAWIIEDDYDSEYSFGDRPLPSLQGADADACVIHLGTFSKTMFPSIRLGYLVLPEELVPVFRRARYSLDTCPPSLNQAAMADFIDAGHFARHIGRMRKLYQERRTVLLEAIRDQVGDRLELIGTPAGMQLTVLLPRGIDDVAVAKKASEKGVVARPLSSCCLDPSDRGGLILGFGHIGPDAIRDGMRKIEACL